MNSIIPTHSLFRDITKFCKDRNIVGTSAGFLDRVLSADAVVTAERCQKYFISCQRYVPTYHIMNVTIKVLVALLIFACFFG